ncbi:MAG: HU family DNA-binding protein [Nitrospinota bacterium]|nr:HU family DNA-binding protein [Nitrospinota bacterium]
MTKRDLVNKVVDKTGLPKNKAEESLETVIDSIKDILVEGKTLTLRRFGSFSTRHKNKRIGRNPKTGVETDITERIVVSFKPGKYLKDIVNK